jgi:hypothetical protein
MAASLWALSFATFGFGLGFIVRGLLEEAWRKPPNG